MKGGYRLPDTPGFFLISSLHPETTVFGDTGNPMAPIISINSTPSGKGQDRGGKHRSNLTFQQTLPVPGEGDCIPTKVINPEAGQPAEQHVVFDPLDQLLFRPDRIEGLQQLLSHHPTDGSLAPVSISM